MSPSSADTCGELGPRVAFPGSTELRCTLPPDHRCGHESWTRAPGSVRVDSWPRGYEHLNAHRADAGAHDAHGGEDA